MTRAVLAADRTAAGCGGTLARHSPDISGAAWSATIVLEGTVPAGVRTLTWSYGWTFAKYVFSGSPRRMDPHPPSGSKAISRARRFRSNMRHPRLARRPSPGNT